ncbi:MAG: HAD-IA family hydrolase [Betaproteobacteria bacterium]|nr:HAD-IA family hydrolase [Betaproteobacteria bacterium]MBL8534053.1 HAD-IA family hydrolase [Betaproteobacteria bacterium]
MKEYDLIVFDWDGTLVDSAAHIVHSIQSAAGDIGLEIPSDERSRHIIGLGLLDAMEYLFPALPRARYGDLTERYRVHYLAGEERVTLFAGVEAGIGLLKRQGRMLAVATGKSRVGLTRAFGSTGLGPYFDASRCADEGFSKPHPDMLEYLLDYLGVAPDRALMVGDTTHDVEMAHGARMDVAAVTFGAHDAGKLARSRPTYTYDEPARLWQWLTRSE